MSHARLARLASGSDDVALTRSPGFWVIVRGAIVFGVKMAFAGWRFWDWREGGTDSGSRFPMTPAGLTGACGGWR